MNELQQILLSDRPLWISQSGYIQAMLTAFPAFRHVVDIKDTSSSQVMPGFLPAISYKEASAGALSRLICSSGVGDSEKHITLTSDFSSQEIPDGAIAYHRIFGVITAASYWFFSSKQLEADLLEAERNPAITCHFLHINSPGGEAWYLDRLSETLDKCEKPIIALYEQCCSAAYHIACHAQRLYANTKFDFVGCIGTMTSFWDFKDYFASIGIKKVEAKASGSDLKNKMFEDLVDGKPDDFVANVLNPINADFLDTVRRCRPALGALDYDAPVLRGETYYTDQALEIGLADGCRTFLEAVNEADEMGRQYRELVKEKNSFYNAI